MSAPKLVLYSYWRSSSSYRVRLALALKHANHEIVPINLLEHAQESSEHRARSPMGFVPCLMIDEKPFVESIAIIELLDDLFPNPPLYPKDPLERAHVRALVETVNAGIQPLQNLSVLDQVSKDAETRKRWTQHFISKGLTAFEALLRRASPVGPFCAGEQVTAADCVIVPQLYAARRNHVDLTPFPRAVAAEKALLAVDDVQKAIPENQPDAR